MLTHAHRCAHPMPRGLCLFARWAEHALHASCVPTCYLSAHRLCIYNCCTLVTLPLSHDLLQSARMFFSWACGEHMTLPSFALYAVGWTFVLLPFLDPPFCFQDLILSPVRFQCAGSTSTRPISLTLWLPVKHVNLNLRMCSKLFQNLWFWSFLFLYFKSYGCGFYGWCSPAGWAAKLPGWRSNPIVNLVIKSRHSYRGASYSTKPGSLNKIKVLMFHSSACQQSSCCSWHHAHQFD